MDAELYLRLKYEKKALIRDRELYMQQLAYCNGNEKSFLRYAKHPNGRKYYYEKHKGRQKAIYLGDKNNSKVKKICKAHTLQEAIRRIDRNIKLVDTILENYDSYDQHSLNDAVPEVYRADIAPRANAYASVGAAWKEESLKLLAQFPENYPENKVEPTSDGFKVKTVS